VHLISEQYLQRSENNKTFGHILFATDDTKTHNPLQKELLQSTDKGSLQRLCVYSSHTIWVNSKPREEGAAWALFTTTSHRWPSSLPQGHVSSTAQHRSRFHLLIRTQTLKYIFRGETQMDCHQRRGILFASVSCQYKDYLVK